MIRLSRVELLVILAQTAFGAAATVLACTVGARLAARAILLGDDGLPNDGGDLPSLVSARGPWSA